MSIDSATLDHLGRLARLALSPDEREPLRRDLEQVLGLFDALRAVPVDGVEPLAHPHDVALRLRPDAVTESDQHEAMLALAPEARGGYYLVPQVIE
jgi:aspartyl-tRNA(Asn)/glutamyl-tRNA(Gln) amidotransferase subunit C